MGVLVLYGSATGKAESIAELLGTEAEKRGLNFEVKCMSEIGNPQDIVAASQTLVAVSSTTGDGEQPETAAKLFRALKRRNMRPDLSGLRFAYLGLGDTNYTQFCNGPKTMRAALLDCGAQEFYPPGWADDGTGFVCSVFRMFCCILVLRYRGEKYTLIPSVRIESVNENMEFN